MKRWIFLAVLGTLSCKGSKTTAVETGDTIDEPSVVVLVMDGVRLDESFGEGISSTTGNDVSEIMPSLREIVSDQGALVTNAYTTGVTTTSPGHVDMVVGRSLPFANYPVDNDGNVGSYLPELPTLFEALEPGEGWLIGNGYLIVPAYRSAYAGSTHPGASVELFGPSDPDLLVELRRIIIESSPRFIVVNLHDIDRAGHTGDFGESGEPKYTEQARELDTHIASFWSWLKENRENATLVITSDHGRHRLETMDWSEHGDQCTGCRQIPMALLGRGVSPGVVVEEPQSLFDLHQTMAALLGVSVPYSQGHMIASALDGSIEAVSNPIGLVRPAAAGDRVIYQENLAEGSARSRIVDSEGNTLSSTDAWMAEEPVIIEHDGVVFAAWRELDLSEALTEDFTSWRPASARWDGEQWVSLEMTVGSVDAFWMPAMVSDQGLWMLLLNNINSLTINGENPINTSLVRYSVADDKWVSTALLETEEALSFPSRISAQIDGTGVYYAVSSADPQSMGRFTRRIEVHRTNLADLSSEQIYAAGPATTEEGMLDAFVDTERLEHPALLLQDNKLHLAMVAYNASINSVTVMLTSSDDGGETWSALSTISSDKVLSHINPRWDDSGALRWLELDGDQVDLCSFSPSAGAAVCSTTGSAFAEGLGVGDGEVWLSVRGDGASPWELQTQP